MKNLLSTAILVPLALPQAAADSFTNFIRQVQVSSGSEWQVPVEQAGQQLSPLAIDPGGARFELWTVNGTLATDYLLDQKYVGTYVPQATVTITSEDPYVTLPRTRADRPFTVTIVTDGMSLDPLAPAAARMAKLLHHAQSYGEDGVGMDIDRNEAPLVSEAYLTGNGTLTLSYSLTVIPSADASKVRGEERFTVNSLPDYQVPDELVISSKYIQIWPVADGSLSGVEEGAYLRFDTPPLTITLNDLYPNSRTYAQAYPGEQVLGTEGTIIPGSAVIINDAVPQDRVITLDGWDSVMEQAAISGKWTIEVLTETPFGVDRLDYVTFTLNRNLRVNGSVTTVE